MNIVIERKNRRALTLPAPGGAITLAFLHTVAVLIALWYALTGGGKRYRRLTHRGSLERFMLRHMVRRSWEKGRFAKDGPVAAVVRLSHIVATVAWHEEVRSGQMPDIRVQRRAAFEITRALQDSAHSVAPHDSS